MNRRQFLGGAATVAAFTIVPRHVLAGSGQTPPSEKLNIACIGIGGQGASDIQSVSSENIVALCDVDWGTHTAETFKKFPNARKYKDFRKMLDAEDKNIDAVTVSTPDNIHAVAAHGGDEAGQARVLREAPVPRRLRGPATDRGRPQVQGVRPRWARRLHGDGGDEAVRRVDEVRRDRQDPQGGPLERQELGRRRAPTDTPPVPETLDWDLWLGPAPYRPYHPTVRARRTGGAGGISAPARSATWAATSSTPPGGPRSDVSDEHRGQAGAVRQGNVSEKTSITWEFHASGDLPAVTMNWYDGENRPPRPPEAGAGAEAPRSGRRLLWRQGHHPVLRTCGNPRLIPETKMKGFKVPPQAFDRAVDHYQDWIRGCKGGPKPLVELRLRRPADRGDSARQRRGPGRSEARMGRPEHEGDEHARGRQVPPPRRTAKGGRCKN